MASGSASFRRHTTPVALFWLTALAFTLAGGCDRAEPTASTSDGSSPGPGRELASQAGPGRETEEDPAGRGPHGQEETLEGEEGGEEREPATAGPAPWLRTDSDCLPNATTIHITGLIQDMSTGAASCSRTVLACGDSLQATVEYDYNTGSCPFAEGTTLEFSIEGPPICCRAWEDAKASKDPCDPLVDADCDGTPNDEDSEPLTPGHSP